MAPSVFKSASKRGTTTPTSSSERIPNRRSRSVSAVSRTTQASVPSNSLVSDEFLNKRDNPLYCYSSSSSSSSSSPPGAEAPAADSNGRRGRSVSRSSAAGTQSSGSVRSGTTARLRSVSREHYGSLEADTELQYKSTSSLRSKEDGKSFMSKGQRKSVVTSTDVKDETRNLQKWTSRHPISESWDASSSCSQARYWEHRTSTSSFSEAEEITAFEALWRKNPDILSTENIVDIPPDYLDTDELVSDMRSEYVSKLEQSQERARKLRADLAVEEQREQELSRIVKEIIHPPRDSDSIKSYPKRKASIECHRMSRRLAEEAMNYFDECVSISAFDESDFSSLEDPQPSSVIGIPSMGSTRFFPNEGSTYSVPDFPSGPANHHEELDNQTQCSLSISGSDLAIGSSCSGSKAGNLRDACGSHDDLVEYDTTLSGNFQLSFALDQKEAVGAHDIRKYIKKFEKGPRRESLEHVNMNVSHGHDDYDSSAKAENLVFDSLILRNRVEFGGLLLCDVRIFS